MSTTGKVAIEVAPSEFYLYWYSYLWVETVQISSIPISTNATAPTDPRGKRVNASRKKLVGEFVFYCLASTEDTGDIPTKWQNLYRTQDGALYRCDNIRMRRSQCQHRSFYCPVDQTLYMDISLPQCVERDRFRAKGGEFAIAYIIAHEVVSRPKPLGNLAGDTQNFKVNLIRPMAIEFQVATGYKTDYFAGVWLTL